MIHTKQIYTYMNRYIYLEQYMQICVSKYQCIPNSNNVVHWCLLVETMMLTHGFDSHRRQHSKPIGAGYSGALSLSHRVWSAESGGQQSSPATDRDRRPRSHKQQTFATVSSNMKDSAGLDLTHQQARRASAWFTPDTALYISWYAWFALFTHNTLISAENTLISRRPRMLSLAVVRESLAVVRECSH